MKAVLNIVGCMTLAATFSCQKPADESATKIINGSPANAASYPHCVLLEQPPYMCTGTFVNDNTVLTANHCVDRNDPTGGNRIRVNGGYVNSVNVFFAPGFDRANDGTARSVRMYDIAVLVFPEGTGASLGITAYPRLSTTSPRVGESVTLMGYGDTSYDPDSDEAGVLRRGQSGRITGVSAENFQIDARTNAGSWVGPGDSGSAQYNAAGEIVGVASQGGASETTGTATNNFKNLTGPNSTEVFNRAVNCSNGLCAKEFRPGRNQDGLTPPPSGNGTSLGITGGDALDATGRTFLAIRSLTAGGAAENAGMQIGDMLWTINGARVRSMAAVRQILSRSGGSVNIVVYRNGVAMAFNGVQLQ